jgi:RsiW-degrading membrane proteinase PrsW (M82 family)
LAPAARRNREKDKLGYLFSIIPVLVFLFALENLDSYKLLPLRSVLMSVFVGFAIAAVSYVVNIYLLGSVDIGTAEYSKYIAPPVEETLKALFLIYLIHAKRVGFLVDAAIFGFAIGAGFAIIENSYYIYTLPSVNPLTGILRGFGTAVMHGGTTAIFGIITKTLYDKYDSNMLKAFLPGLLGATVIHSLFNHFYISPVYSALVIIIVLPAIMLAVFKRSETALSNWLGIGFDADAQLLEMITSGEILNTHVGSYLVSLKRSFPGEVVADMLCLLRIHIELSIKAKGILMIKGAGFPVAPDAGLAEKFNELEYLQKSIGGTGMLALRPLLRWSSRDLWQLHMLGKKTL